MNFIIWILVGIFAGWLAEKIMGRNHGLVTNLIVGLIGALVGGWLASIIGLPVIVSPLVTSIITATAGAVLLLFLLGLVKKR
jgi:Predicted membrane protein